MLRRFQLSTVLGIRKKRIGTSLAPITFHCSEWQVVLLFLGSVSWGIRHIVVSDRLLADIQEVDVLGMNSQLCVRCAVLALPLVNLHVALNGQDASFGKILHQLQMCRVAALHSYPLCLIQEAPACISAGRGLAVWKWNHFMIPRWLW